MNKEYLNRQLLRLQGVGAGLVSLGFVEFVVHYSQFQMFFAGIFTLILSIGLRVKYVKETAQ